MAAEGNQREINIQNLVISFQRDSRQRMDYYYKKKTFKVYLEVRFMSVGIVYMYIQLCDDGIHAHLVNTCL